HGVYSWVPEHVRDHLLKLSKTNLAPHGVAYVSYNTYPGWYFRAPVRDLMHFHVRGLDDPHQRVQQARAILGFMSKHAANPDSTWARVVREEDELSGKEGDYYLFHEHLEDNNHPVYFRQFIAHAQGHGLQYLGESQTHTTLAVFDPEV